MEYKIGTLKRSIEALGKVKLAEPLYNTHRDEIDPHKKSLKTIQFQRFFTAWNLKTVSSVVRSQIAHSGVSTGFLIGTSYEKSKISSLISKLRTSPHSVYFRVS